MMIYCCGCEKEVEAVLVTGAVIYPHRKDLHDLPFWRCDTCRNYVGCHHKTANRTRPLGNIPTPQLKNARKKIHELIDPIWKDGRMKRNALYAKLSELLGYQYHTAEIRTVEEARRVYRIALEIVR